VTTLSSWSGNGYPTDELWEYDPATNSWTQKASLPTTPARNSVVSFSIGTKGYIGIGYKEQYTGLPAEYYNDFWEWDQATNVWTKAADYPGSPRYGAFGVSIGNKAYIGTGSDYITAYLPDFWEYDPTL
jgi:N-acetylneuraminic acid mutarotase